MGRSVWRSAGLGVFCVALWLSFAPPAHAATLTTTRDYLSRQEGSLTSGEVHQLFFTPATALLGSGNTFELQFPITHSGLWCRAAGSDGGVAGITNPEGGSESAQVLPGTLTGSCTVGNGSSTGDSIVIGGIDPLAAGQKYGVTIAGGLTMLLGTPGPAVGIRVDVKTTDGASDIDTGLIFLSVVANDRVTVQATVTSGVTPSNPVVQFRGRVSLNADVIIKRDGVSIQTTPVDSNAKFDITLTEQPTGQHVYDITADDASGREHASATFALNLTLGSTTLISGIFLGPTIDVDKTSVKLGEMVTLFGRTAPDSALTLTISPDNHSYGLVAESDGDWTKAVDTDDLGTGTFVASVMAVAESTSSEDSLNATFSVNPIAPCDGKVRSDLNCDGRVNLTDFSIMLFFWHKSQPSNPRADINQDGTVSIVDFSIMLYQWTG